jgi:hypothetical protein
MADRFPLIANSSTGRIEEITSGDNLNLQGSGITSATTISASTFVGNLQGQASSSVRLTDAANIDTGFISPDRLSGNYNINVTLSNSLTSASNIGSGILSPDRLSGLYPISITGVAATANSLTDASQIEFGVIDSNRLSGTYNIDITGTAFRSVGAALSLTISQEDENINQYLTFVKEFDVDTSVFVNIENLVYNPGSNYLGIGTSNPNVTLDVYGDIYSTGIGSFSEVHTNKFYGNEILEVTQIDDITKVTFENALGITSLRELEVSGISTFEGMIITQQTEVNDLNVVGVVTVGSVGISSQFIDSPIINVELLNVTGIATLNGLRNIIVSGISTFENLYISNDLRSDNLNVSGITTLRSLSIGSTQIFSEDIQLQNLSSIDDVTKNTLRNELGLDQLSDIVVSGISTFDSIDVLEKVNINDIEVLGDINVAGVATFQTVNAFNFVGDGSNLTGILTSIVGGIGIDIDQTEGNVIIQSYRPIGKTIYVSQTGNDNNTGLAENHPRLTIKSAASIALPGDTIKVFPGYYLEENPIVLLPQVAVEGTELRNCQIRPKTPSKDLFLVNNGVHITDLSFVGSDSERGASVIAFQPLLGTSANRYFDAAKLIRLNLDYIARESVGYITSSDYRSPAFTLNSNNNEKCIQDIKNIFKEVCFDITRGGNSKCVGAGKSYYADTTLQHIVGVKTETIDALRFAAGIAQSCINNVQWEGNYQNNFSQVLDLGIYFDPETGSNTDINSCANVISAVYSCVGIVTTIIDQGPQILGVGINTTYPGNSGVGFTSVIGITSAVYDNEIGTLTFTAPGSFFIKGDIIEIRDILFENSSETNQSIRAFPSGEYGYEFYIDKVLSDDTYLINLGVSDIPYTYVSGGIIVDRSIIVSNASYDSASGIVTVTAPGLFVFPGDVVTLKNLEFSYVDGIEIKSIIYPSDELGYEFEVIDVVSPGQFSVNIGISTITYVYESGGFVRPPYSKGVGPITQGPYIRNCTNFIPKSIGMRIDGFTAEPGNKEDIGVQGSMSVDSYTQFNQGGIGVSISNGAYAQLVSIFTICDEIAIYTESGGQCDLTNSNSSFGTFGLVSNGVGDNSTKSIYTYTGFANNDAPTGQNIIEISGVGSYRPYDGQVVYFDKLYQVVQTISVINGGSGYTTIPRVSIAAPTGPNGITAQATATLVNGSVSEVTVVTTGTQYETAPIVTIEPPTGVGSTAIAEVSQLGPIYYRVESSSLPMSGISTVTLVQNLNNTVSAGTTAYFSRLSLQLASSHAFEFVGAGNNIQGARPAQGGVTITDNEIVKLNGGDVVYTSTDQAGNFRIGDGIVINQATGTLSGRDFTKALFTQITPFILALAD